MNLRELDDLIQNLKHTKGYNDPTSFAGSTAKAATENLDNFRQLLYDIKDLVDAWDGCEWDGDEYEWDVIVAAVQTLRDKITPSTKPGSDWDVIEKWDEK